MKEFFIEIRDFLKKDFNIYAYSYTVLFLAIVLYLNYKYNFEDGFIDKNYGKLSGFWVYPLYYIVPYYTVIIPVLFFKKQQYKLQQSEFWLKSLIFFGTYGFFAALWQHRTFLHFSDFTVSEKYFIHETVHELRRIVPFIIIFFGVKSFYDKRDKHLYGLRYKGLNYRPFFLILILILPLIVVASFQSDFQQSYPQFKFWNQQEALGMSPLLSAIVFEIAYGADFVSVELLFRGALVVGMSRVLGKEAVLPMAAAYVIIHFGKPVGEAVSSFFGGLILGIHSFVKRNIFGGIIIHVGIAYFMEIAAILQHYYN